MSTNTSSIQLAVIGGGPGGYPAAYLAADLGIQVTLIDLEPKPGGVCLYRGCIPSKTLIHAVEIKETAQHAGQFGLVESRPQMAGTAIRGGIGQPHPLFAAGLITGKVLTLGDHRQFRMPVPGSKTQAAFGQVEGGIVMCIGNALTENYILEDGVPWTDVFARYKMPSIKHTPEITSFIVEHETADGPYGAKGVGEAANNATAAAVANAIYNAVGIRFYHAPITPEVVMEALKNQKGGE